jgi:broad specificity phosphatase PhoE
MAPNVGHRQKNDESEIMRIILLRHFKVNHQWKKQCTYKEFCEDLNKHDVQSVIDTKELDISVETVYISALIRTAETASFLKGEKNVIKTNLINELNVQGVNKIKWRLSNKLWYLLSLLKWRLNSKTQNETHKETKERAYQFLRLIEDKNEDCIVVSHGMFLMMLMKIMEKEGYSGGQKRKSLKNGEMVEYFKVTD